jgi:nucleotide-binding universal stress UspA family protein
MFKRILVPTDGSDYSAAAFDYAVFLADSFENALVCGLSVVDIKTLAGPLLHDLGVSIGLGPFDAYQPKVRKALQERAEAAIAVGREKCQAGGVEFESHTVDGIISREILRKADGCDLVVMGKLGEHADWRSSLFGHTVETVVRASHHPVLVTPQEFCEPTRALIAYDGSTHSYDAMHDAGELAVKLVIPLVTVSAHSSLEKAEEHCQAAEKYLSRYGVDVKTIASDGNAEDAILATLDEEDCDLLVMGAYGHTRIRELILGSTTEHVMRKAKCPILLHRS